MKRLTTALSCFICGCFLPDPSLEQAPPWTTTEEETCFSWQVNIEGECIDLPPSGRYSYEIKSIESTCSEVSDESLEQMMNFSRENMAIGFKFLPGEEGTRSGSVMYGLYPLPRFLGYHNAAIYGFDIEGEDFIYRYGDKTLGRYYIHNAKFRYDFSEKKFIITTNHHFLDGISNPLIERRPTGACKETWIFEGTLEEEAPLNCIADFHSDAQSAEEIYRDLKYEEVCMPYFPYEPLDGE